MKSIAEAGLRAGTNEDQILAQIKKQFPGGKADVSHIRYYRHFLVKAGELEKQPRAKKEKVEKAPKSLKDAAAPEAPKTSKSAAKGSQPVKQTSSKGASKRGR